VKARVDAARQSREETPLDIAGLLQVAQSFKRFNHESSHHARNDSQVKVELAALLNSGLPQPTREAGKASNVFR
jgi:hypothetical protein